MIGWSSKQNSYLNLTIKDISDAPSEELHKHIDLYGDVQNDDGVLL